VDAVAIDIGGTWTRIAGAGRFRTEPRYADQLARLAALVSGPAGVSFCGRLTRDGTRVARCLNLPDFEGRPLAADLAAALRGPVTVAHDATCGLLGEHHRGALRAYDRCAYVTLSTGTGAAVRLGGVVLSTEAGHQIVPGVDRLCRCGQVGCLETVTRQDPIDLAALALGLANLALVAGVDAVALGGGIIRNRPDLLASVTRAVAGVLTYQQLVVLPAALGDGAPLAGASVLATGAVDVLH
jgi:glucokinase